MAPGFSRKSNSHTHTYLHTCVRICKSAGAYPSILSYSIKYESNMTHSCQESTHGNTMQPAQISVGFNFPRLSRHCLLYLHGPAAPSKRSDGAHGGSSGPPRVPRRSGDAWGGGLAFPQVLALYWGEKPGVPEDFLVNQSIEDLLHSWDLRHQCWSSGEKNEGLSKKMGSSCQPVASSKEKC